jgi:hypothetical protein
MVRLGAEVMVGGLATEKNARGGCARPSVVKERRSRLGEERRDVLSCGLSRRSRLVTFRLGAAGCGEAVMDRQGSVWNVEAGFGAAV